MLSYRVERAGQRRAPVDTAFENHVGKKCHMQRELTTAAARRARSSSRILSNSLRLSSFSFGLRPARGIEPPDWELHGNLKTRAM